ncbi:MAG: S41 family peptidase [Myxococcaceae bacterium]
MAISVAAVVGLLLSSSPTGPSAPNLTSLEVRRLVHLGQLWSTVKTFHPALFTTNLDWDAALIEAEPRVRSAKTREEYSTALAAMLARLRDPDVTHLVRVPVKPPQPVAPSGDPVRWADGKVLVLSFAGLPFFKLGDVEKQARGLLPEARAVVVDLRNDNVSESDLFFLRDRIGTLRAAGGPRLVFVEHRGYRPQDGSSSGYDSLLMAREPATLGPVGRPVIPVTFVVRPSLGVLPTVLAFQAAGNGRIVSDGPFNEEAIVRQETVDLGEGLSAVVRTVALDGALAGADVVAEPDKALDEAIRLSRTGPPHGRRQRSPGVAGSWKPDKTYADTPYPNEPLRVLAALRLWSIVKWFYPYRPLLTEDWDQVLGTFLPKLISAKNATEYALALAEMSTHIPDGHTSIRGFETLAEVYGRASPPILVSLIENQYVVTRILNVEAAQGLRVGDVITAIGGEPVSVRVSQISPLIAASTAEAHRHAVAHLLLLGSEATKVTIEVVGADGKHQSVSLPRRRDWNAKSTGPPFKVLPGNIGYLDLRVLQPDGVAAAMEGVRNTRALVIDLRGYPKGVFGVLGPFLNERNAKVAALFYEPRVSAMELPGLLTYFEQGLGEPAAWTYGHPVVTLVNERAVSQSEHTALWIEAAHGTTFIGSPTAGANGDVTVASLPGGGWLQFTGQDVRHADGRQLQKVGIVPDVEARPTVAGVRAGRDEVLEVALKWVDAHVK